MRDYAQFLLKSGCVAIRLDFWPFLGRSAFGRVYTSLGLMLALQSWMDQVLLVVSHFELSQNSKHLVLEALRARCPREFGEFGGVVGQIPASAPTLDDPIPIESVQDGWTVREAFLNIKTIDDLCVFLSDYGVFLDKPGGNMKLKQVTQWQEVIRWLLSNAPSKWGWFASEGVRVPVVKNKRGDKVVDYGPLTQFGEAIYLQIVSRINFTITFRWATRIAAKGETAERHTASILATDVLTAILATVYVDQLRSARYAICARPDCLKPYEITSRRKRFYCSQPCAHIQSVRRNRAKPEEPKPVVSRGN
jgi:hypothetical protein